MYLIAWLRFRAKYITLAIPFIIKYSSEKRACSTIQQNKKQNKNQTKKINTLQGSSICIWCKVKHHLYSGVSIGWSCLFTSRKDIWSQDAQGHHQQAGNVLTLSKLPCELVLYKLEAWVYSKWRWDHLPSLLDLFLTLSQIQSSGTARFMKYSSDTIFLERLVFPILGS